MKRVINGKRYDTAMAFCIASAWNHLGRSDFKWMEEALYRTKAGNWFLAGKGGPLTKYRRQVGDAWTEGEAITALTGDEARQWLEEHGETEAIEQQFKIEDA
jgi:hypothetical protein